MEQNYYSLFERHFCIKIIVTLIPANLVTIHFYPFFVLSEVGGVVKKNIYFLFIASRAPLYLKGIPNSIDFYKRIFFTVIPVHL